MATFSEVKSNLDEIARKNHEYKGALTRALNLIREADNGLAAMPSQYAAAVADVDLGVTDNPGSEAFALAQSEKNELVKDFQALKVQAANALSALDAIINE